MYSSKPRIWKASTICMHYVLACKLYVRSLSRKREWAYYLSFLIVLLNEHSMYDYILKDEVFRGVVGMLECMSCF